jgi:GT2 family glycosyltransferase
MVRQAAEKPWLSVVIPTYNGGMYLNDTLTSLVDQYDKGFECIIVDGGSTDATLSIIEKYRQLLDIQAFHRPDLANWGAQTNFAVGMARANYIRILHQDDLWAAGLAGTVRRMIDQYPGGVMYINQSYFIDDSNIVVGKWRCPLPGVPARIDPELLVARLLVQNFISMPATTLCREAYLKVGGIARDLWYTGDWDLYLKIAKLGYSYYTPMPLSSFRIHNDSLTMAGSRDIEDFRKQMTTVLERHAVGLADTATRRSALREGAFSIEVNTALAAVVHRKGVDWRALLRSFIALGPLGIVRYVRYSRIIERAGSRLLARLIAGLRGRRGAQ